MRRLIAFLLLSSVCSAQSTTPVAGYHVRRALAARELGAGMRLELLEDERFTPAARAAVVEATAQGERPCEGTRVAATAELCASAGRVPVRLAIVRLVNKTDNEVGRVVLDRTTGELSRMAVSRRDSVFAVTVDLSADAGSYSGPVVRFMNVTDGRLGWVRVVDDAMGDRADLALPTTLKTAWRIFSETDQPEILLVSCRPDLDRPTASDGAAAFAIIYSRFYIVGGQWHRADRRSAGIWENEGDFPARTLFP